MERKIAAADGTLLSVRVTGRPVGEGGKPALLLADGIGCDGYIWKYVRAAFEPHLTLVHLHHRGHGGSAIPSDRASLTVPQLAADLWQVCDALGVDRAILWGHSMGVQVTLHAAYLAPSRCAALLPTCGAFEKPLTTFRDSDVGTRLLPWVRRALAADSGRLRSAWRKLMPTDAAYWVAVATEVNGRMIRRGDFLPYLDHLADMDPSVFVDLLAAVAEHSARPFLPALSMPALVFAGSHDHFTPARLGAELAQLLPAGELCVIPGGSHTAPLELPDLVQLRTEEFFKRNHLL